MASPVHGVDHYENFPVASWLMPARLRPAIVAIYRFARHADDLADEGDALPATRVAALQSLVHAIDRAESGQEAGDTHVQALVSHVHAHGLSWAPFRALLSAFMQDVHPHRFADTAALLDYCSRSADPVGHLVLGLAGRLDHETQGLSNAVCTALQRINFLQDMAGDWRRGRLYLPQDAMARYGIQEADIAQATDTAHAHAPLRQCIAEQALLAHQQLMQGAPLAAMVGGRIGWELRAIVAGGRRILDKLEAGSHDPFAHRPALTRSDGLAVARMMVNLRWRPPAQPK
jgi:squalene synthase HpnC